MSVDLFVIHTSLLVKALNVFFVIISSVFAVTREVHLFLLVTKVVALVQILPLFCRGGPIGALLGADLTDHVVIRKQG